MRNGECIAENTFLQARELQVQSIGGLNQNGLYCLLASVGSTQVRWLYPNDNDVDCSKTLIKSQNYIGCSKAANSNGAILYTSNFDIDRPPEFSGVYTCCLQGNCFDGSSNSITVRIFGQSSLC